MSLHEELSVQTFNEAWNYIDRQDRTPEDELTMLSLAWASYHHWLQRPDCTATNRSIGMWQLSRVHALAGEASLAEKTARQAAADWSELEPVYRGWAKEALARALFLQGRTTEAEAALVEAEALAAEVSEAADREALEADLRTVRP